MARSDKMSGVVLTGHGGFDRLVWRDDLQIPKPGRGDVLIRVRAAALNETDVNTRIAWYSKGEAEADDASWSGKALQFPRIQGADLCGEIAAVGDGVERSRIGERVLVEPCLREAEGRKLDAPWYFGSECDGGFAQFARAPSRHVYKVESALSDVGLASFPCSYSTAENMLTRIRLAQGESVLVTGASGGVGSAAVQLARARGAKAIAMVAPAKAEALRKLGASQTLDRDEDPVAALGRNRVDAAVDLVGGARWSALFDVLRCGGRCAVAGAIAGATAAVDVRTLYLKDLSVFGCTVLEPEVFGNMVRRIERGDIEPLVAEIFPLREIVAAQKSFGEKSHIGKIVLEVP